jgi:acyl-CoA hydrolase
MPHLANLSGHLHGGELLSRIDKVAAVAAMRHAGGAIVTACIDQVDFHKPIKIGSVIRLVARVQYVGRSSMEVAVKVYSENAKSGEVVHTNSCYLTMVGVDQSGAPVTVPSLDLETEDDKKSYDQARERARARKARRTS